MAGVADAFVVFAFISLSIRKTRLSLLWKIPIVPLNATQVSKVAHRHS